MAPNSFAYKSWAASKGRSLLCQSFSHSSESTPRILLDMEKSLKVFDWIFALSRQNQSVARGLALIGDVILVVIMLG